MREHRFYQLNIIFKLKKDVFLKDAQEKIAKFLNKSMLLDEYLSERHKNQGMKYYVFDNFSPIQRDGVYKEGNIYKVVLRSIDNIFINKMITVVKQTRTDCLQVISVDKNIYLKISNIQRITTTTPAVISFYDQNKKPYFWTLRNDGDILKLQKALQDNLLGKYNSFFNEELKPDNGFIRLFELKTRKGLSITYEDYRFLGNKFVIIPNEDEVSQKLAFTALACGLGEKNSIGCGFCV